MPVPFKCETFYGGGISVTEQLVFLLKSGEGQCVRNPLSLENPRSILIFTIREQASRLSNTLSQVDTLCNNKWLVAGGLWCGSALTLLPKIAVCGNKWLVAGGLFV